MAWEKGKSGNPGGRKNDKPWAEALRIVGARLDKDGTKRLLRLAEKCFQAAEGGDISAIREIGDRHDGKPAQESTLNVIKRVEELTDEQIAARIAELRGAGASGDDGEAPLGPSQLN